MRSTVCSETELDYYLTNKSLKYVQINDEGNKNNNLWPETSKFLCTLNAKRFTDLTSSFANDFILPNNVKEVCRTFICILINFYYKF